MRIPDAGPLPALACPADPRFSSYLYLPRRRTGPVPLVVAVHGTDRRAESLRDALVPWAEERSVAVLAPLFPGGLGDADDIDDYKFLRTAHADFDRVLLAMADDAVRRFGLTAGRWGLVGFSGGAQFAHRFLLVHPERVAAAAICAPGNVTRIDPAARWWPGTGDFADRFGAACDPVRLREVAVQTVVGALDDGAEHITLAPGARYWAPGANDAGATRVARTAALAANLRRYGIGVREVRLPGVGHDFGPMVPSVTGFLDDAFLTAFAAEHPREEETR
ncbi:alpha/beta hydrolase [Streptomyces paludis]|uniref:Alpha/beta hydrolase n=1 Tax=Streptomyces paludis TaxID=2282738 RepID=A0A345HI78_9ACTN|nr:alpha/beta hydrolase [Streptomyces paludis]AXG76402.1 alpha/beta hydrolase [Streptomyces paludis]